MCILLQLMKLLAHLQVCQLATSNRPEMLAWTVWGAHHLSPCPGTLMLGHQKYLLISV